MKNNVILGKNVKIGKNVSFGEFVVIADDVTIGDNVKINHHCVIGQLPFVSGVFKRKPRVPDKTIIRKGAVIGSNVVLYAGCQIGKGTIISDLVCMRENCRVGRDCIIGTSVTFNAGVIVKNNARIIYASHITSDSVIEDDVFVSALVSTTNDNKMARSAYKMKGVRLKKGSIVGAGVTFLPNITVGVNAVVGAGSVVTKNVPSNKVVMGIPAKVVKNTPADLKMKI